MSHWSTVCRVAQFPSWQGLCLHIFSYLCCTLGGKAHHPKKLAPVIATHIATNYFWLITSRHNWELEVWLNFASAKPWVQTPIPPKKRERERETLQKPNQPSFPIWFFKMQCRMSFNYEKRRPSCTHIHTHIQMYMTTQTHRDACSSTHMYSRAHTYMHVCMCACVNVCTRACVYVCECLHVCIYECVLCTPFS
jgi:hypothetical protein